MPFTAGNELVALRNGDEIFPAMLEAIERARSTVDFLTFVYWTGDIAERFAETLQAAARRGVRTRVVLDSVGAHAIESRLVDGMRSAGVQVGWFRPVRFLHLGKASHRTHRKVLICDGQVGFTGGVGIAEEWTGNAESEDSWRDTHFRVRGPAVAGLEAAFLGNWYETGCAGPEVDVDERVAYAEDAGPAAVQVLRCSAAVGWSDTATCFRSILQAAEERVRIATPYFVPDEFSAELLFRLPARGVRVELLVPGPYIDERVARLGAKDHYERLLSAGVDIHQFQPTMFHAKVLTADATLACIGSANFNHRSMRKDDEVILNVIDRELVAALDGDFDADLERSREVDLDAWRERGLAQRLLEKLTRPLQGEM